MSKTILNSSNDRLQIFVDHVAINKSLPKWKEAEKNITVEPSTETLVASNGPVGMTNTNSFVVAQTYVTPEGAKQRGFLLDPDSEINSTSPTDIYQTPEGISFNEIAAAGIKDLNRLIAEQKLKYVIGGYGSFGNTVYSLDYSSDYPTPYVNNDKKPTKFKKLIDRLFYRPQTEKKPEIDVTQFFTMVKALSKDSAANYVDRVSKYLIALHNAVDAGQTALQEELIKAMVTNKYEAALAANGYYYVVTEEQMVDFVKKCEKGLSLCYVKNFVRALPQEVVDKMNEANSLEIFDNYVILYYDKEKSPFKTSEKETAMEEAKRRDPILFGLIAGSEKLYYITDWIDEYCDLTLDKFVDTLGIEKEDLHVDGNLNKGKEKQSEEKSEEKTEKKPKSKKRHYNKKKTNI